MATNPIDPEEMTYEAAIKELEEIISALEDDKVDLEKSLLLYERGQALVARSSKLLEQAELKLKTLTNQLDLSDPEEEVDF